MFYFIVNNTIGGWIDGWMDVWMNGWMVGWMDGCMDGWMYGWMDRSHMYLPECQNPLTDLILSLTSLMILFYSL